MMVLLARPDLARKGSSTALLSWMSDCLSGTGPQKISFVPFTHAAFQSNLPETLNNLEGLLECKGPSMGAPSSHLSEVNAGDKVIGALFTAQRGHLHHSIINCASFWGPVFFTQHLQASKYRYFIIHPLNFC